MNKESELLKFCIENANLSEALECLENAEREKDFDVVSQHYDYNYLLSEEAFNTIKQVLIKAQEQEKENTKYKQLENQIGCSLEVFIKLHNVANIYDNYGKQHKIRKVQGDVVIVDSKLIGGSVTIYFPLNEYQKTWWLRPDRSE